MPTYEYQCTACGYEFEKYQSITAPSIRKCPECKKLKVQRLISSGAGIIFKGSGFYETDYRSGDYNKEAQKDTATSSGSSASSASGSSTETKTEKKSAKKNDK